MTERRKCTKEEIAEVLDGFEEELLADLEKRKGLKQGSLPRTNRWGKPKAKVLEFPEAFGADRQREVLREAERRLIDEEKRSLEEGRKANRALIEERRRMGEYHASMKRMHMEAEFWAKESQRDRGGYDPNKVIPKRA